MVAELDSDMPDIAQTTPVECVLGEEEESELVEDRAGSHLSGLLTPAEPDLASMSSQIMPSLGINPHSLQVVDLKYIYWFTSRNVPLQDYCWTLEGSTANSQCP